MANLSDLQVSQIFNSFQSGRQCASTARGKSGWPEGNFESSVQCQSMVVNIDTVVTRAFSDSDGGKIEYDSLLNGASFVFERISPWSV